MPIKINNQMNINKQYYIILYNKSIENIIISNKFIKNYKIIRNKIKKSSLNNKKQNNKIVKIKKLLYIEILYYFINILIQVKSYSEIKLTIKGKGTQQIIYNNENMYTCYANTNKKKIDQPSEIYVNDILYNDTNYYSVNNLKNEINNITIKWNNTIKDCNQMFRGLIFEKFL